MDYLEEQECFLFQKQIIARSNRTNTLAVFLARLIGMGYLADVGGRAEKIALGVVLLRKVAADIFNVKFGWNPCIRRLENGV